MMELRKAERPALDWVAYCAIPITYQIIWDQKGDAVTTAILLLLNFKNNNAKKDLRLVYSQGNKSAYLI